MHFRNCEEICYKFLVYNFHFCWDLNKIQRLWLGVRLKMKFRPWTCLLSYICCFDYINGCIATPVVEARACDYRDLGSSPSGTLLDFSYFFTFLTFLFYSAGPPLGLMFFFLLLTPCFTYTAPGPFLFSFSSLLIINYFVNKYAI